MRQGPHKLPGQMSWENKGGAAGVSRHEGFARARCQRWRSCRQFFDQPMAVPWTRRAAIGETPAPGAQPARKTNLWHCAALAGLRGSSLLFRRNRSSASSSPVPEPVFRPRWIDDRRRCSHLARQHGSDSPGRFGTTPRAADTAVASDRTQRHALDSLAQRLCSARCAAPACLRGAGIESAALTIR